MIMIIIQQHRIFTHEKQTNNITERVKTTVFYYAKARETFYISIFSFPLYVDPLQDQSF